MTSVSLAAGAQNLEASRDSGVRTLPTRNGGDRPRSLEIRTTSTWFSSRFERKLDEAQKWIGERRFAEIDPLLDGLESSGLNVHERAAVEQVRAMSFVHQRRFREAADSYRRALAQIELDLATRRHLTSSLGQVLLADKRFAEAVFVLEPVAVSTAVQADPAALLALAHAYAGTGRDDECVKLAERVLESSEEPAREPLRLLTTVHLRQGDPMSALETAAQLVQHFPDQANWLQLAAIYGRQGDMEAALATLDTAYDRGMITGEREILLLARMMLGLNPVRAAAILDKALSAGDLSPDGEGSRLLAEAWTAAGRPELAVDSLRGDAESDLHTARRR